VRVPLDAVGLDNLALGVIEPQEPTLRDRGAVAQDAPSPVKAREGLRGAHQHAPALGAILAWLLTGLKRPQNGVLLLFGDQT